MKALVLFSGGLDSTVLATQMRQEAKETRLFSIDYGQRHAKELDHSQKVADHLGIPHEILKLPQIGLFLGGSSLTDKSITLPEGHYAEESMKSTVVPNRNMILLSIAGGHALSLGFDTIAYAAHAGDHTIYPDCRPDFADAMNKALGLADWNDLYLHCPYVEKTKSDLVSIGDQLGAPFYLTWSCYAGGKFHCGKCGTCVERKEAFALANVPDPTKYEN
jgi:7-cyano-7-deazaguanine synthase